MRSDEVNILQQELADTNRDVLALTLELDKHIEELHKVETELRHSLAEKTALQQQLEAAKQVAEAASKAKSDFLARMSHEIRTPMNLINGMNALLLESPLNEKQRKHVEISFRNVRRLLRLINGILDLSKVEAGEFTFDSIPFNLDEVLQECAATISSAIERKGLHLETLVDARTWLYWRGDPERLQQVLLNLVGNAIKFTSEGKVQVLVSPELGSQGQPGLRFEVSDTGCGIPADKADLIFEAFQQADGSMNRQFEGTGLGLTIAKTFVEKMAGKIWVGQKTDPGTTIIFTIFLPAVTEEAVEARTRPESIAKVTATLESGLSVLIAEDNPENVILLQAYLEGLPLKLDFAANGLEAYEKRQRSHYDLILMDIQMPVMDGYVATSHIRDWERQNETVPVPIVALTAHALNGAANSSLEAGCCGHLTKPVDRHELVETIARYTRKRPLPQDGLADMIRARRPHFLANRKQDSANMRAHLNTMDFAAIQKIAHNCKGTGTGYGFPAISKLGAELEQAAKARDEKKLDVCLLNFERLLAEETTHL